MTAIEFAKKMELDGVKFYSEMAAKHKGDKLQVVFELLADEEKKHAEILQKHADVLTYSMDDNPALEDIPNVFVKIEYGSKPELKMFLNQVDLYREALDVENQSVALYEKLLAETGDDKEKELFGYLLQQEKAHVNLMSDFVEMLDRSRKTAFAEAGMTDDY